MDEQWRDIEGFPDYMVSSLGRVKSRPRPRTRGGILKQYMTTTGYWGIALWSDAKKKKPAKVHRLVAEAFIPNPDNKPYVDHIDGVPSHNFVSNLRWCTRSENMQNQKSNPGSSSQFKGVSFHKLTKKWRANIRIDGNLKYLGLFENEEDAARAYDAVAKEVHGDFARFNFP